MRRVMLVLLLILGVHGARHNVSHNYLNFTKHGAKKIAREKAVNDRIDLIIG